MADKKSMPAWFAPALIISGFLSLFGLIKKAKAEGIIKEDEK